MLLWCTGALLSCIQMQCCLGLTNQVLRYRILSRTSRCMTATRLPMFARGYFPPARSNACSISATTSCRSTSGNESFSCSCYSGALASGPYDAYFVTDRVEEASIMGVQFRPGGAFPFLGLSVYEFANAHIDLAASWGRDAGRCAFAWVSLSTPRTCPAVAAVSSSRTSPCSFFSTGRVSL